MKAKHIPITTCFFLMALLFNCYSTHAQVVSNKSFSFGSYGRVGVGYSPSIKGNTSRQLNLNGMGSIGGRMEEQDYVELIAALHFKPLSKDHDSTEINVQTRMALFSAGSQFIGNITSQSIRGLTISLPELYAEANHIRGSKWSVWAGAKFFRDNDIHMADHFFFDDHSSQGFGIKYNRTHFAVLFPAAVDTNSSYPPYFYTNIVNGTATLSLRQRTMFVLEHLIPLGAHKSTLKLLGELHQLSDATAEETSQAGFNYPSDKGWVIGVKHSIDLATKKTGSFNQLAVRYGTGIANGGDGGGSKTWLTYGAPNLQTQQFKNANSISIAEHFLLNLSDKFSLNGYLLYTKSKGASDSSNKAADYFGRSVFNRKNDFAIGFRSLIYLSNWFHLVGEWNYTTRKDGTQDAAAMMKFTIAPTFVPTGIRDVFARPHIRLVFSVAHYNKFAQNNLYSPFLQQAGSREWGTYIGVKTEWWLF